MGNRLRDITGLRVGRLVVVSLQDRGGYNRHATWLCLCDCGNTTVVRSGSLVSGRTKSCGCVGGNFKHGHRHTPTWRAWRAMRQRCFDPGGPDWKNYGGRGIGIDDPRWDDFLAFLADMGEKPPGHDLHRKDNDKGYSKANCVWLPHSEHMRLHYRRRTRSLAS